MSPLTDLNELKGVLDIDPEDPQEDKLLGFLSEYACDWIEEILDRPVRYASRTEYYSGTGTKQLLLRCRPVYLTPQVWIDEGGAFGSVSGSFDSTTAQVYGEDFALDLGPGEATSRSGILVRLNGVWPLPTVRSAGMLTPYVGDSFGTVKVTYTAGWTVDTVPSAIRMAAALLIGRLRGVFPLAVELSGDNLDDRSVSIVTNQKNKLLDIVRPLLLSHRNWTW